MTDAGIKITDPGVQWRVGGHGCICRSGSRPVACSGCGAPGSALAKGGHSPAALEPVPAHVYFLSFYVLGHNILSCGFGRKQKKSARKMITQEARILGTMNRAPVSPRTVTGQTHQTLHRRLSNSHPLTCMHDIHQQQKDSEHNRTSAPVLYSLPPRNGLALGGTASFKTLNRMLETSALLPRLNWQPARRCASSSISSTLRCKGALQAHR